MNKILPEMELGKLRKSDEALIDSETNEVVAEMVELQYIEGELKKLFDWIAKESQNVHPLLKAVIHP